MAIDSKIPEISELRLRTEARYGHPVKVHADFVALSEDIFITTKEHLSESTLERVWSYSTRGYETVSRRTLDVLCNYLGKKNWENFLKDLQTEGGRESDFFDRESIKSADLVPGCRLRIGWHPDRECIIRYLGDNRYKAEDTRNSQLKPGDTFSCLQFFLQSPAYLEDLSDSEGAIKGSRYGIGLRNGLTRLQLLEGEAE